MKITEEITQNGNHNEGNTVVPQAARDVIEAHKEWMRATGTLTNAFVIGVYSVSLTGTL